MKRAFFSLVILGALCAPTVHAAGLPAPRRHATRSEREVRITPTQLASGETAIDIGPDKWSIQGFDLRGLLAHVFDLQPAHIQLELPELVDASQQSAPRYDLSVTLNGDEADADIQSAVRKAIEQRFHLTIGMESRSMEVYVLTAPAGPGPGLRAASSHRFVAAMAPRSDAEPQTVITVAGRTCPGISSAGITAESATVASLAAALEDNLDRIVVDETHLARAFNFQVPEYRSREQLFSLLHDGLGLSVQSERREVKVLRARRAEAAAPTLLTGI